MEGLRKEEAGLRLPSLWVQGWRRAGRVGL